MKDILKKLVENEILTEDTQKEVLSAITEAIDAQVAEKVATVSEVKKAELEESFKADFKKERTALSKKIDKFLKENIKGALSESIREDYKTKFEDERSSLIENVTAFLDIELAKSSSKADRKSDATAAAFYESVKSLVLNEQDIPEASEKIIKNLQESLQKKEAKINRLYTSMVEARKREDEALLENKIEEFVRLLPTDKKTLGRRLVEGVSIEEFDSRVEQITPELLESGASDETIDNTSSGKEVVIESHKEEESVSKEAARIRKLSGVK